MENKLLKQIDKELHYLVGFSSGPDSVFLLQYLIKVGFKNLSLCYVNYHDNALGVIKEEELLNYYAHKYHLNAYIYHSDSTLYTTNFEAEARKVRYKYFEKMCQELGAVGVFIAHQEDDLIETYIYQKLRKSDVSYYGIRDKTKLGNLTVLRPLVGISRNFIIDFLNKNQYEYYDDVTNYNLSKSRNKIRNEYLLKMNDEERKTIIEEINEKNLELEKTNSYFQKMLLTNNQVNFSYYYKLDESSKKRFLFFFLAQNLIGAEEKLGKLVNKVYSFLVNNSKGAFMFLRDDLYLYRQYNTFFISPLRTNKDYSYTINSYGAYEFDEFNLILNENNKMNVYPYDFPLTIRNYHIGDKFCLGEKEIVVRHYLMSQKVPSYLRSSWPVVISNSGNIIFVPNLHDMKLGFSDLIIKFE